MSKERLRGIENRFRMTLKIFDLIDDDDLLTKDVLWLIEQNKRYQELLIGIRSDIKMEYTDSEIESIPLLFVIVEQIDDLLEGEE